MDFANFAAQMKKKSSLVFLALLTALTVQAQQIRNMGFDTWSKSSGAWNPYAKDAPASQRAWDTANKGLSLLGVNGTVPEYEHLAVPGKGKAAAKIESKKVLWAFVAGNLYTGQFVRVVNFSGAEMYFGVPFTDRPKSLSGFIHYIPKPINYAKEPYLGLKGRTDTAWIEVILTDWDSPDHVVSNEGGFTDADHNPHVIAKGTLDISHDTGGYVPVDIPLVYRNGKTPKYSVIIMTSSKRGAHFTGGSGSVLYVDEFQFNY